MSNDSNSLLLEASSQALFVLQAGKIIQTNKVAEIILGEPKKDLKGCSFTDFIIQEERSEIEEALKKGQALTKEVYALDG
ncbi:MAG: PAS domain-containing protein, partial [Rhodospirillales bacterium]|nr:PAS domain-containing protein [Rhodospirillales bacterium]